MAFSGIPSRITADIGTTGGLALDSSVLAVDANLDRFTFAADRLLVDGSAVTQPVSAVSLPLPTGAATSLNQGVEIASLASIDGKLAPLGPALAAGSMPVTIASDQSPIKTDIAFGTQSVGNSSVATLTAGTTFTGAWENVTDYAIIAFSLFSDQASAVNGLSTQWSSDGSNVDVIDNSDVFAGAGRAFSLSVRAKFFRIVYTNGPVNQATFRLTTIYHKTGTGLISRPMTQNLTDNNYAQTVRSAVNAKLPSGSYKALSMGQTVSVDALSVVIASDQSAIPVTFIGSGINIEEWGGVATTLGQKVMAASVPVVLASDEVVPISAASLPLPTGASTSALQSTANSSLSSIDGKLGSLGQKLMAGSAPVVLASDHSPVNVNGSIANGAAGNPAPVMIGAYDGANVQSLRSENVLGTPSLAVMMTPRVARLSELGFAFQCSVEPNMAVGGAENPALLLRNPGGSGRRLYLNKIQFVFFSSATAGGILIRCYTGPTVTTAGTAATIVSKYFRTSPTAPVATAFTASTISVTGTRFDSMRVGGTNVPVDSVREYDLSVILDPGQDILITGNPSANNRVLAIVADWVEVV